MPMRLADDGLNGRTGATGEVGIHWVVAKHIHQTRAYNVSSLKSVSSRFERIGSFKILKKCIYNIYIKVQFAAKLNFVELLFSTL